MANKVKISEKPVGTKIKTLEDLAIQIKYKRTSLGMSKQDVADLCNVNYKTIDNIEKAQNGTRFSSILYIANMLGLEINIT